MILPSLVYRESTSLPMYRVSQGLCNLLPFHVLFCCFKAVLQNIFCCSFTRKYANYHLRETVTNSAKVHSLV